ncbi:Bifunctional protein FolD protein [bioreactor metagenome]|uniref:Bifunctional protein FolD protein n=1 Tax=bioreactor metagenome TaxID=1076179 RepID=A0A645B260_9ZZZZ
MAIHMKGSEVIPPMEQALAREIESLRLSGVTPRLAVVRLGARPDDLAYERSLLRRCGAMGIDCKIAACPPEVSQQALCALLEKLNRDREVHGILLMRPLPAHMDETAVKAVVSPRKDVDCISPEHTAKVFAGDPSGLAPCTAEAVVNLLKHYGVELRGRRVTVVGRSLVVGRPLSMLLLAADATVTLCHSKTDGLADICRGAEILCAAAGRAKLLTEDCLSPGQIVVDIGIHAAEDGSLCGDVDFAAADRVAAMVTPVRDGVGAVTSMVLAEHVVRCARRLAEQATEEAQP